MRRLRAVVSVMAVVALSSGAMAAPPSDNGSALMPLPKSVELSTVRLPVAEGFDLNWGGHSDERLQRATERLLVRVAQRTGQPMRWLSTGDGPVLHIDLAGPDPGFASLEQTESYRLRVDANGIHLVADGEAGVLRGLATVVQMVAQDGKGFYLPGADIVDAPRFPWRGLMVDVARHFQSLEALKRQVDGMELVKLNVLHLHLSDNEGFRMESQRYPLLHLEGSDGLYYTQAEMRDLIHYAADRGIRIVPEFDVPAHTRSWFLGYPELSSDVRGAGPETIPERLHAAMDPTKESTYVFLEGLFGEMAELFPDEYFHSGADEVTGVNWLGNAEIVAYMEAQGIADTHELQAMFSTRLRGILAQHGKRMVGWNEIMAEGLPTDIAVQSWTSSKSTVLAANAGHSVIVSAGYYLDWLTPAGDLYQIEPLDPMGRGISAAALEQIQDSPLAVLVGDQFVLDENLEFEAGAEARVLGGVTTMWTEVVTEEKLDMTIWPRTAAFAERMWSPAAVRDVDDMYRRLAIVDTQLDLLGMRHRADPARMMARLAPANVDVLVTLASALEPTKYYATNQVMRTMGAVQSQVFNALVDALPPDNLDARRFEVEVRSWLAAGAPAGVAERLVRNRLARLRDNHWPFSELAAASEILSVALPVSEDLQALAEVGLEAVDLIMVGGMPPEGWAESVHALLDRQRAWAEASESFLATFSRPQPPGDLLIAITPAISALLEAAELSAL